MHYGVTSLVAVIAVGILRDVPALNIVLSSFSASSPTDFANLCHSFVATHMYVCEYMKMYNDVILNMCGCVHKGVTSLVTVIAAVSLRRRQPSLSYQILQPAIPCFFGCFILASQDVPKVMLSLSEWRDSTDFTDVTLVSEDTD